MRVAERIRCNDRNQLIKVPQWRRFIWITELTVLVSKISFCLAAEATNEYSGSDLERRLLYQGHENKYTSDWKNNENGVRPNDDLLCLRRPDGEPVVSDWDPSSSHGDRRLVSALPIVWHQHLWLEWWDFWRVCLLRRAFLSHSFSWSLSKIVSKASLLILNGSTVTLRCGPLIAIT